MRSWEIYAELWKYICLILNRIKSVGCHSSYNVEAKQESLKLTKELWTVPPCVLSAVHLFICHVMYPPQSAGGSHYRLTSSTLCTLCPNQLTDLENIWCFCIVVAFSQKYGDLLYKIYVPWVKCTFLETMRIRYKPQEAVFIQIVKPFAALGCTK